jgi:hypothetical protein
LGNITLLNNLTKGEKMRTTFTTLFVCLALLLTIPACDPAGQNRQAGNSNNPAGEQNDNNNNPNDPNNPADGQDGGSGTNGDGTGDSSFYVWRRDYLEIALGTQDNGRPAQWSKDLFVAGSDFNSLSGKKWTYTLDDVVDHYGDHTYYYNKVIKNISTVGISECHWRRGQSLNFDTKEAAEEYVENNESQLLSDIDRDVTRVTLYYNDETDEYETVPSDNDGLGNITRLRSSPTFRQIRRN